jgi:hypothetical protein
VIEKVQLPARAILDVWGLWKLPLRLMRLGWRRVYPGRGGAAIEPQKIQDSCLHLPMRSMKWRKVFRNIEQDVASATSVQRARPIYYPSGLFARMLEVQGFTLGDIEPSLTSSGCIGSVSRPRGCVQVLGRRGNHLIYQAELLKTPVSVT